MEDKIIGFQFEPAAAKPIRPSDKFQKLRHFVKWVNQDFLEIRLFWNLQKLFADIFQNKRS